MVVKNPYELLHQEGEEGKLPPNLHIQLDPHRFTGTGDHPLDQVHLKQFLNGLHSCGLKIVDCKRKLKIILCAGDRLPAHLHSGLRPDHQGQVQDEGVGAGPL